MKLFTPIRLNQYHPVIEKIIYVSMFYIYEYTLQKQAPLPVLMDKFVPLHFTPLTFLSISLSIKPSPANFWIGIIPSQIINHILY